MKRILIIDDSEMVRNFHTYILKMAGYEVMTAIDGSDGLEKFFSEPFDLVITDLNMPIMDGYTLIARIRAEEQFDEIPIIISSTEDESQDKQKGFNVGANIYMVKPTEPGQMVANVKLLLD
ncbi:response regulator [Deltaproteobacteria bacterium TL4]